MRLEVLLLLAGWVATFGFIIVIPWTVVRLVSGVLEISETRAVGRRATLAHEQNTEPTDPPATAVDERLHSEIEPIRTRPRL